MQFVFLLTLLLTSVVARAQSAARTNPDSLRIIWSDVDHFWQAYDLLPTARSTADSLALVDARYLSQATPGLRAYVAAANATSGDIVRAIRTHRHYLAAIRPAMQAVGQQRAAIIQAARQLKAIYPAATFPDLYFAVGKFEVGGTQFDQVLYLGAELKCASPQPPLAEIQPALRSAVSPVTSVSTPCIHEIIHGQQQLRDTRTNLDGVLREGAAEYLAFRLTGRLGAQEAFAYGRQHEANLRRQFAREAEQPIVAKWFLATPDPTTGQPGALGYFIGFRICAAYYAQARDKQAALRHLVALDDLTGLLQTGRTYLAQP